MPKGGHVRAVGHERQPVGNGHRPIWCEPCPPEERAFEPAVGADADHDPDQAELAVRAPFEAVDRDGGKLGALQSVVGVPGQAADRRSGRAARS